MENPNENGGFQYTYSAKEQAELQKIREKYMGREEDATIERLRRLDRSVGARAQAVAIACGVVGALILGFGMSLFMSELGKGMGLSERQSMMIGIPVGIVGAAIAAFAYPLYRLVAEHRRKQVAPEILRLTEEMLK